MHFLLVSQIFVAVAAFQLGYALNWETTLENTCVPTQPLSSYNMTWVATVPKWYTVFGNRAKVYRIVETMVDEIEFESLSEQRLRSEACIFYIFKGQKVPIYAFGDKVTQYEVFPNTLRPGVLDWAIEGSEGKLRYVGTSYVTITDNKSYIASVTIWTDGLKGFSVASTEKKLPTHTMLEIKDHMSRLGFNSKNFITLNYDNCKMPSELDKSEL